MASCSERGCVFPPGPEGLCKQHARAFSYNNALLKSEVKLMPRSQPARAIPRAGDSMPGLRKQSRQVRDWSPLKDLLRLSAVGEETVINIPPDVKHNPFTVGLRSALFNDKEMKTWRWEMRQGEIKMAVYVKRVEDWPTSDTEKSRAPAVKAQVAPEPLKRDAASWAVDGRWRAFILADPPEAQQLLEASLRYSGPVKQTEDEYIDLFDNIMPQLARKVALHRKAKQLVDNVLGDWIRENEVTGHERIIGDLFMRWHQKVMEMLRP